MESYVIKRIINLLITLFMVSIVVFLVTQLMPGDPASVLAGPQANNQEVEFIRNELGLDESFITQFKNYFIGLLKADLGHSYTYRRPVLELILSRFGNSILLTAFSILISIIFGILFALIASTNRNNLIDHTLNLLSTYAISLPSFWVSIILVLLFSVRLKWLPSMGVGDLENGFGSFISYMILPGISLALVPTARIYRVTRNAIINEKKKEYILFAQAKGLKKRTILFKYALKNSLPDILTLTSMMLAGMLGGSVIIESIFSWPGLGGLVTDAIGRRDIAVIRGVVIFITFIYVFSNFLLDLLLPIVNPKIAFEEDGIK